MATDALSQAKSFTNSIIGWLRWLIHVALWVVLAIIVARMTGVANHIVPNLGEAQAWIYAAGFYWLISR